MTEWKASGGERVWVREPHRRFRADPVSLAGGVGRVPQKVARAALAKIVEVRPARMPCDDRFEVRLIGGRAVGVPASFDETALGRLLRVLEAAS